MASAFEQLAEQKILEAIENGVFDDLALKGQPLDLEAYFATPAHLRMAHSMLKSNGFVPPEVELMHQIAQLEESITLEHNPRSLKSLEIQLSHKKAELAMAMDRIKAQSQNQSHHSQSW